MLNEYKKELNELETKMRKAEAFAKKVPIFSSSIISRKITGEEHWTKFTENYKTLYCAWGINRGLFIKGTNRNLMNYLATKPYREYLFSIYINTLTVYDGHKKYELDAVGRLSSVFYYDKSNSTFYVKDENIEEVLNALVKWKEEAVRCAKKDSKQGKILALQKQIDELNT